MKAVQWRLRRKRNKPKASDKPSMAPLSSDERPSAHEQPPDEAPFAPAEDVVFAPPFEPLLPPVTSEPPETPEIPPALEPPGPLPPVWDWPAVLLEAPPELVVPPVEPVDPALPEVVPPDEVVPPVFEPPLPPVDAPVPPAFEPPAPPFVEELVVAVPPVPPAPEPPLPPVEVAASLPPCPPAPPPSEGVPENFHQLKLNKLPVPEPVKTKKRSCTPLAPLMGQVLVTQVWAPPVPDTAQVPTKVPVLLSRRTSMLPPLPAEATRTSSEVAPPPKSTPLTLR